MTALSAAGARRRAAGVALAQIIVPEEPTNLRALPGNGSVTLVWTEPVNDGGSPILRYQYHQKTTGVTAPN